MRAFGLARTAFTFFQRGQLYRISDIDNRITPVMYKLTDLLNTPLIGQYYAAQLHLAPTDVLSDFFEIEKILSTKSIDGQKWGFVKFHYYPNKFNQWVVLEDIKTKK
jgi:hypothetical protein